MKFRVQLETKEGKKEVRTIDAENRFSVYAQLEGQGVTVIDVSETKEKKGLGSITFGTGIKDEEKITFTKNLAAMLSAGLTLSRALSVIERQSKNKYLKAVVADIEERIKTGGSFHEALMVHNKVFSELFIAMTKAGEESGTLAESLRAIARQMDRAYTLQKKVKGAMIYPSIIVSAIIIIGVLMLMFVVPTLSSTFASLGVKLPLATQIIVGISNFLSGHVILTLLILAGFFGGVFAFIKSKFGAAVILRTSLHIPVIGDLVRETMGARASRALSSLLSSGVEMLTAISIASEVVGKNMFGAVLVEAEERVRKGEALSATFMAYPKLFPPFVSDMILVGEETGKLAEMLGQVAEYYETDVEDRTKDLSTIIEPMLMLFIGVFVGVFAISMIAPIYSLSDKI
ncbi:MAG: type II secretion system F family protein [Neisseriaceae bacterium]|nr:MAG: type II secretion system F family protein [Neisseriaceae bacterium]